MSNSIEYTLLDGVAVRAITSSTNATPIVVTATAHGLVTGDRVTVNGHTTNTAANGTWVVTRVDANTFSLDTSVGNGVGGATGCFAKASKVIFAQDFTTVNLNFDTDNGGDAALTIKLVGSDSETAPDFAEAQSPSNSWDFIKMVDLQGTGGNVDGDTGFVVATADDHRQFEAQVNGKRWLSVLPTAGTAGEITVRARLFNHN